jgi:DNA-directed RNA polymerase subunit beta'
MLGIGDFDAVRISLASPEQIRSWSYGEVTKPETINYRTLRPEKDGIFCEKIFGPTRDFECYCGKYKKMRYKGVICEKCGVEVAHSKVRRERMAHIGLTAPVSHIWFARGIPSRLGLLLDLSPRSLDRVLYFAQYIITSVNEVARKRFIQQRQQDTGDDFSQREGEVEDKIREIEARLEDELKQCQSAKEAENRRIDEELSAAIDGVMTSATLIEGKLKEEIGEKAKEEVVFEGVVIVPREGLVDSSHVTSLRQVVQQRLAGVEGDFGQIRQSKNEFLDAETGGKQAAAMEEINLLRLKLTRGKAEHEQELSAKLEEVEELRPLTLLTESRYRELKGKYGKIFQAGMGAEAILEILKNLDLEERRKALYQEFQSTSGQVRKKANKQLRVVEAFHRSGNKPEWMILTVLPVLPPELRPMVQLDGGRFATSDLNDLYRRVINRNNRLRRLVELEAPEIIIRNEKRMLQEAVDSLIDNGRRGQMVSRGGNHKLKSLSDMLRGKQGRFRQNLLGKRVDYSGRSVIVVGPELQLHQCGLPKRMALELFKPFIMHHLVQLGLAHNIKTARRLVEKARPEVWDILEEVIKERPVLLNRAPTLHRLSIQAFEPVLIDGGALQVHPLVCAAFNADFDGDQMAVHVPLSQSAVREAREKMLSIYNMLLPSCGEPVVTPTLDMVLGCYYVTSHKPGTAGEGRRFGSFDEAKLACDLGVIDLRAQIKVRDQKGQWLETSVGRIVFNDVLPPELRFYNQVVDKAALKRVVGDCLRLLGNKGTALVLDNLKRLGFHYATRSGTTIGINDIEIPSGKAKILEEAEEKIAVIESQYGRGLITEDERYYNVVQVWTETTDRLTDLISQSLDRYGGLYMMATSGAKGNISQIRQMAGMRGLMTDPSGRIIDFPIKSCFREGLGVLEYFISTHGARKGLADTALRTSNAGYLTRRLVDIAQDVIILQQDCGTTAGIWLFEAEEGSLVAPLSERLVGRLAASQVIDPQDGRVIVDRNEEMDEEKAREIVAAGTKQVYVRSPLLCQSKRGVCQYCYGGDLSRRQLADIGTAVGIIAAQSIGEPGTQLTLRTFHTGGIVGTDITSGLPRVEELFEARAPKGQAIISEIDGTAEVTFVEEGTKITITSSVLYRDPYQLPPGWEAVVDRDQWVDIGAELALPALTEAVEGQAAPLPEARPILTRVAGKVAIEGGQLFVCYEEKDEREYIIPATIPPRIKSGSWVKAGERLTDGPVNPQHILRIMGKEAVQQYQLEEIQKVYRSQGVNISDKHIEIIMRQMLSRVRVDSSGDTDLLSGELVDRFEYEEINARVLAEGGEPATAQTVLLGITRASLNTDSWLSAASFQETTRVLTEAAVAGKVDRLEGLKENVIIGRLIPASCLEETTLEQQPELAMETAVEIAGETAGEPTDL